MPKVIWPEEVIDQLDQIKAHIRLFDPDAADRMTARLMALVNSSTEFPARGRPGVADTRELTTVVPYVLSYKVVEQLVVIVDVRHGRRRQPRD